MGKTFIGLNLVILTVTTYVFVEFGGKSYTLDFLDKYDDLIYFLQDYPGTIGLFYFLILGIGLIVIKSEKHKLIATMISIIAIGFLVFIDQTIFEFFLM